jgi:magnesium transporter
MLGLTRLLSKKPGLPPGTLVHVGEKEVEKVRLRIIYYDEENLERGVLLIISLSRTFVVKP